MKVIYMQETILEMSKSKALEVEELVRSGEIKKSEEGKNYLVIHIEDGDSTTHQEV